MSVVVIVVIVAIPPACTCAAQVLGPVFHIDQRTNLGHIVAVADVNLFDSLRREPSFDT